MAINRATTTNQEHLDISINNGDFQAMREAMEKLGFRDEESMLRFMLAVLTRAATRTVIVTDQNGSNITLSPSESLLQDPQP